MDIEKIKAAQDAMELFGGNQMKAAKHLGLARSSLQNRLRKGEGFESQIDAESESIGFPKEKVKAYWVKSEIGSYYVKCDTEKSHEDIRQSFLDFAANHAPSYTPIRHIGGEHLLVVDAADLHINKLATAVETGQDYNMDIAEKRLREGVTALVAKALPHGISKIIFVMGNDILNCDNPQGTTTSGTRQDNDGMWHQGFLRAKKAYIAVIEELTQVADVHLIHCPSNHDFQSGWMLADSVCSWFSKHPNVHIADGSVSIAHRKYVQFGSNLLMFTHGDGAKEKDLPTLMQYEARHVWSSTRYSYIYVHHLHHKSRVVYGKDAGRIEKDHIGVTTIQAGRNGDQSMKTFVEVVRSPSPPDRWHSTNGYTNEQAIEAFLHHPDKGQVARFTNYF